MTRSSGAVFLALGLLTRPAETTTPRPRGRRPPPGPRHSRPPLAAEAAGPDPAGLGVAVVRDGSGVYQASASQARASILQGRSRSRG